MEKAFEDFECIAGANVGFSEGRGPNIRKGANEYKTKKKGI